MGYGIDPPCAEIACFACKNSYCTSLRDNDFGKHKCPFFKTENQLHKERKRCQRRLERLERGDNCADR